MYLKKHCDCKEIYFCAICKGIYHCKFCMTSEKVMLIKSSMFIWLLVCMDMMALFVLHEACQSSHRLEKYLQI